MKDKKNIISALILIIVALFIAYSISSLYEISEVSEVEVVEALDTRECYTYSHEATEESPYTVNEFIKLNIKNDIVTGTKTGTQAGPDMTNGYEGTLAGTIEEDIISVVFAYTIEGSANKEQEIYRTRPDQTGIEKLRYPLVEENGVLVPDITKEFKAISYTRVDCTAGN